jgi:hypothetical protein
MARKTLRFSSAQGRRSDTLFWTGQFLLGNFPRTSLSRSNFRIVDSKFEGRRKSTAPRATVSIMAEDGASAEAQRCTKRRIYWKPNGYAAYSDSSSESTLCASNSLEQTVLTCE